MCVDTNRGTMPKKSGAGRTTNLRRLNHHSEGSFAMTRQKIADFKVDAISASDQALIDAYITKNGITQCKYGERAIEPTYTWDGKTLVPDGQGISWRQQIKNSSEAKKRAARCRPVVIAAIKRRGEVSEFIREGWTIAEMARHFGVSEKTTKMDCNRIGSTPRNHYQPLEEWLAAK